MLKAVRGVREEVCKRCTDRTIDLETITNVFRDITTIDEIAFVPFETDPSNPIWGRFTKYDRHPAPYALPQTCVDIGYAAHLPEDWRRFVVSKELCHALEDDDGVHSITNSSIDTLVDAFVLRSASGDIRPIMKAFAPEVLAEVGAVEILFPLPLRDEILASQTTIDENFKARITADFNVPAFYVEVGLDVEFNNCVRWLLENDTE